MEILKEKPKLTILTDGCRQPARRIFVELKIVCQIFVFISICSLIIKYDVVSCKTIGYMTPLDTRIAVIIA